MADERITRLDAGLAWFSEWSSSHKAAADKLGVTQEEAQRRFLSRVTYEQLLFTVAGFKAFTQDFLSNFGEQGYFISPVRLNQSCLESFFGWTRSQQGSSNNPTMAGYTRAVAVRGILKSTAAVTNGSYTPTQMDAFALDLERDDARNRKLPPPPKLQVDPFMEDDSSRPTATDYLQSLNVLILIFFIKQKKKEPR